MIENSRSELLLYARLETVVTQRAIVLMAAPLTFAVWVAHPSKIIASKQRFIQVECQAFRPATKKKSLQQPIEVTSE